MGQEPNVEITQDDMPRPVLQPGVPRRWAPPAGTITTPEMKPSGGVFGTPGPDTGWALRIINHSEIPQDGPRIRQVLAALMSARAAHFGRAPVPADLEVALLLAGMGKQRSESLDERRRRWEEAAAHERTPGRTAVAEVGSVLFQDLAHADMLIRR
ncbi:MAG: hypothetical protein WB239_10405 [Acidimicrobiia bacterium]